MTRPDPPHADDWTSALTHFNESFRHRYHLPRLTEEWLATVEGVDDAWGDIPQIRMDGVLDASCAILARVALSISPRYAIGLLDSSGQVQVLSPTTGAAEAYRNRHVLLVNPLGGPDNWEDAARWVHQVGGQRARRTLLAELASEERPDHEANERLLRSAAGRGAIALPPDETFSAALAAEVAYIYGVNGDTLRSWKRKYRGELSSRRPGRPRKPLRFPPNR